MSPYKINTPIILSIFGSICSGIVGGLTSRILPPSLMSLRNLSTDSNFSMIIILLAVLSLYRFSIRLSSLLPTDKYLGMRASLTCKAYL